MNTNFLRSVAAGRRLGQIALGALVATTAGCSMLLNDVENAAGREVGKALVGNSGNGSGSATGTTNTSTTAPSSNRAPSSDRAPGGNTVGVGSGGGMGSSGATSSGSCAMKNADGTMMMCTEFSNIPAEASEIFQHNACFGGNSTWGQGACPTAGRMGGCKSKADDKGAFAVVWQYMPNMAKAAEDGCRKNAQDTWIP